MKALFVVHCSLFIHISAEAQSFTQRLQETAKGEATVTVHHDQAIDKLVNGPQTTAPRNTKSDEKSPAGSSAAASAAAKLPQGQKREGDKGQQNTSTPNEVTQTVADTTALDGKSTHSYKTTGYRVQVFAGGNSRKDRQKAEQTGNQLRMLFPLEAVYVHFYSPRWICRMGNYRTYEEAHQALEEVKKLGYTAATIVKGKITVQY